MRTFLVTRLSHKLPDFRPILFNCI
uniref:Uncharacterized protein n=1 Tax=Anguilla anguilla TaxID=7936 RepID=A0A0E9VQ76_ANGAN